MIQKSLPLPRIVAGFFPAVALALVVTWAAVQAQDKSAATSKKPLRALLIAGGCCHDYETQHQLLYRGIQERANIRVDVWWTDDKSVNPPLTIFDDPDWAQGYDIIIHDECAAGNKNLEVMKRVLDVHQEIPAVHLHCAMHSFRNGTDQWFQHLGLKSTGHGPQEPIEVEYVDPEHPITKTLENWTTKKEELYNSVDILGAEPLAMGRQVVKRKGEEKEEMAVIAWTNETAGARSFSTSLGHNNYTVEDDRYLDLLTRGLLWACDQLEGGYLGIPYEGENEITFVKGKPKAEKKTPAVPAKVSLGDPPKDATLVKVTASSEETGKRNYTWHAIDGSKDTRWCAANSSKPQWLQLEFDEPKTFSELGIAWESANNAYRYRVEFSMDGKSWAPLVDAETNDKPGDTQVEFAAKEGRFLRITCTGSSAGGWASIREVSLKGPKITTLFPKLDEKAKAEIAKEKKASEDPFAKEGNIKPKIVRKTAEEEAEILKDVTVPEGFDVSLFSTWEAANYPVYVAAAPNGDLYVSSDGNGSLGRDPHRGRVLRLRDENGDGRADEVTEFIPDIDSPRGLIWDQDRLYLLHPPHISVFFDRDGDGVAEESKRLIENIAFDFSGRPADHTTNALEMGIDGWIYIAGGDFGFLEATGTDGRKLQHRGGGVIRFRPDGSGLELFATGTRNILGTPTSPLLDIFARDNTNDGGGWDVRFHHFSGLEDHGYPRMYKNFGDEIVQPLADYGGGSGCGSVYIHEPGFPDEWKNAPFTCDWGTGALWHHSVERIGATFQEVTPPRRFIKMTRPTDADVDGMSAVYQASWKGPATFKWAGPEAGYIVRVTPSGFEPEPLPDFEKMSDLELVAALESASHIRTLAAQRMLLRREETPETMQALLDLAGDAEKDLTARVAALYAVVQRGIHSEDAARILGPVSHLPRDPEIEPFIYRSFGDFGQDRRTEGKIGPVSGGMLNVGLATDNLRTLVETMVAAVRQKGLGSEGNIANYLGDEDPVVAHTAFRSLAMLGAHKECFALVDNPKAHPEQRRGAAFALMRMHEPEVVDGLIERLAKSTDPEIRRDLLMALCRLYHTEAEWTGDSWGTRPDTRGPYYQLATWEQSDKILEALKSLLAKADAEEAAFLVKEMSRNRIQSNEALDRMLSLAREKPEVIPDAVAQLAAIDTIPTEGIDLLVTALAIEPIDHATIASAIIALSKTDSREGCEGSLVALGRLHANLDALRQAQKAVSQLPDPVKAKSEGKYAKQRLGEATKQFDNALKVFLGSPKLENHHGLIETMAASEEGSVWADAALLALASRKGGSPESREMTAKAVEEGWKSSVHRASLIRAAGISKNRSLDERITAALKDADPKVAAAAKEAAGILKLKPMAEDKTPKIATLDPAKALSEVVKAKGDLALGEAIYARATCVACHTVTQDEPQKGPYLGNIAETYPRPDLAVAILDPNKTIAQGFASNVITLKDGTVAMGFVTDEQGEQVTIRDIAAQEHTFQKADIAKRDTLPTSMMPPGLMNNFTVKETASLLDYLEALAKKK